MKPRPLRVGDVLRIDGREARVWGVSEDGRAVHIAAPSQRGAWVREEDVRHLRLPERGEAA